MFYWFVVIWIAYVALLFVYRTLACMKCHICIFFVFNMPQRLTCKQKRYNAIELSFIFALITGAMIYVQLKSTAR